MTRRWPLSRCDCWRCRTETVYRHVIIPAIQGGATVMDSIFDDPDADPGDLSALVTMSVTRTQKRPVSFFETGL